MGFLLPGREFEAFPPRLQIPFAGRRSSIGRGPVPGIEAGGHCVATGQRGVSADS